MVAWWGHHLVGGDGHTLALDHLVEQMQRLLR